MGVNAAITKAVFPEPGKHVDNRLEHQLKREPTATDRNAKQISCSVFYGYVLIALLVFAATCSILCATLLGSSQSRGPTNPSPRTLTFADRVAYQRAIEDVYWRHRIWPKERPDPKPSLDAVMSQAQLEKKVEDYLRNSQALEDYWQRPITAEQLQAEMERMASTPNSPKCCANSLKRLGTIPLSSRSVWRGPCWSERLISKSYGRDKSRWARAGRRSENRNVMHGGTSANYTLPTISDAPNGCIDDTWTATSTTNAPTARYRSHGSVDWQ